MISVINLFTDQYIGDGSNVSSAIIPMENINPDAKFFVDILASGGVGDVKGEYLLGNSEADTFIDPAAGTDIFTGHKKISGTSGRDFYAMSNPLLAPFMKIKFTQEDGTNVTITSNLIIVN